MSHLSFREVRRQFYSEINPLMNNFEREYLTALRYKNLQNPAHLFTLQFQMEMKIRKASLALKPYLDKKHAGPPKDYTQIAYLETRMLEIAKLFSEKMRPFEQLRNRQTTDLSRSHQNRGASGNLPSTRRIHYLGLENTKANCAFNALIQFLAHIPGLIEACKLLPASFDPLKELLQKHLNDEKENKTQSTVDSQVLRELLYRLSLGKISASPWSNEDANEALRYILNDIPHASPIYSKLITSRHFEPTGREPIEPNNEKLIRNEYSKLDRDNNSIQEEVYSQMMIDIPNTAHVTFDTCLDRFFHHLDIQGSDNSSYLENDGRLHSYCLKEEHKKFVSPPQEMLIVLKRFDSSGHKNDRVLPVPLQIELRPEASLTNKKARYALDGFVVHSGQTGSGHYVAYLNIDGKWVKYDDKSTREISESELKSALEKSYFHHFRRL